MARSGGLMARVAEVAFTAGLGFGLWGSGLAAAAQTALHCRNTASGATWDIPVDLAHGEVDSRPARITPAQISWEDATKHFYVFDRATGRLDMHVASSMGGFYAASQCVFKE